MRRKADTLFTFFLVVNDSAMAVLAFYLAYWLRQKVALPPPVNIAPFSDYLMMMGVQVVTILVVYFFSRLYDLKLSHLGRDVHRSHRYHRLHDVRVQE
jgi:hypothetical protein